MGMIGSLLGMAFGNGRNVVRETAEVFRVNAEAEATRDHQAIAAALAQHAAEFQEERSGFDRLIDGLNRLPRPAMALGAMALFVSAMTSPVWFAERMQGLALVPEAMWWLLGAVVSFYFGARHQVKGQEFQREIANVLSKTPQAVENIRKLKSLQAENDDSAENLSGGPSTDANPALEEWRRAG